MFILSLVDIYLVKLSIDDPVFMYFVILKWLKCAITSFAWLKIFCHRLGIHVDAFLGGPFYHVAVE